MTDRSRDTELLVDLVRTPSVSGHERAASECFARHAIERGFDAHIDDVSNAIAHRGPADNPSAHIIVLGHIDTVPGHIDVRIDEGVLFGRGSVDAKGPLAAMLCAAERALLPPRTRVSVIAAVGEETARSPGVHHIVDQFRPDACIIGEPSGWDGVTLGYKGRLLLTAHATVAGNHSAGPEQSAGDLVTDWWAHVRAHIASTNAEREGVFNTIQASVRAMRSAHDGLSETASIETGYRLPPGIDPHALERTLTDLSPALTFNATGHESAHTTDRNDPVVRALTGSIRATGARPRPKLKTGTADLNVVGPVWNCPIAAYGPGDSALDHTPNEHLSLDEYARSIAVLTRALETLAAELAGRPRTLSTPAD